MSKLWVILDLHNLAYRHWFVNQGTGRKTPVIAGLLRDLRTYQARWSSASFVFCSDQEPYLRREVRPGYKTRARNEEARTAVQAQCQEFMDYLVMEMGFHNCFRVKGAEADDLIAAAVYSTPEDRHVLISSDQDLYQLLHQGRTQILSPVKRELVTEEDLKRIHDVLPVEWPTFKALIGCESDQIEGVPGIGPAYATQFIRGRLNGSGARYKAIEDHREWIEENERLIRLPYITLGLPKLDLVEDDVDPESWDRAAAKYGFQGAKRQR